MNSPKSLNWTTSTCLSWLSYSFPSSAHCVCICENASNLQWSHDGLYECTCRFCDDV